MQKFLAVAVVIAFLLIQWFMFTVTGLVISALLLLALMLYVGSKKSGNGAEPR